MPLWLTIPAYFAIGVVWAVLYLPRSVGLQARRYKVWRDETTGGRPLEQVLGAETTRDGKSIHPSDFLDMRDHVSRDFSERRILTGFMVNIAFWPLRIIEKFVVDCLSALWRTLCRWLSDVWHHVVVPVCRWVYRRVMALYQRLMGVYQAIIRRANREAIADMAILNAGQEDK
ncbi:hypothetical protein [Burkholderia ubonensis]|uniref:hypothetical protein n=1 Tax=Burkholderia ubonensis TaxID=101571 RepID=UPI0007587541|nr:hypothetical protein [Burkholderia ubonensis]KVP17198.1 hypothetical protein WJ84_02650 [Burkholderia ubonensis]